MVFGVRENMIQKVILLTTRAQMIIGGRVNMIQKVIGLITRTHVVIRVVYQQHRCPRVDGHLGLRAMVRS